MLRTLVTLFALAALPLQAQTCGTDSALDDLTGAERAELDALVAVHPYPTGNLWRAEKDGQTVVVVGTLHIPDPRLAPFRDAVAPYVAEADLLILEATSEDQARLQALAAERPEVFFLNEGPTLIDLLGDEDWQDAKSRLEAIGVPGFLAAKFQPWYAMLTLAITPCVVEAMQTGEGLDKQLEEIARDSGVPIAALDDAEAVLRIFADAPLDEQLTSLRATLDSLQEGERSTATVLEAYFDQEVRAGWEFMRIEARRQSGEEGVEMFDTLNQQVLIDRNEEWEPKILSLVADKDAVLAVGAAHLSGETGVLRALERAGYAIAPLE